MPTDEVNGVFYDALRNSSYSYVANGTGEIELYDLRVDPFQLANLHGNAAYADAEAALAVRLAALSACAGESCRRKPSLKLRLPRPVREDGRSCRESRDFVAKVEGKGASSVTFVSFRVGATPAGGDSGTPLKEELRPKLLRAKREPEIRAIAELVDGRVLQHAEARPDLPLIA